jgi:hypothetical protein
MKTVLYTILFLAFSVSLNAQKKQSKLIASCESRGCTGSEYCSACKNCSGCKHCAKEGGSCGVCSPPTTKKSFVSPSRKKKSKKKK